MAMPAAIFSVIVTAICSSSARMSRGRGGSCNCQEEGGQHNGMQNSKGSELKPETPAATFRLLLPIFHLSHPNVICRNDRASSDPTLPPIRL